MKSANKENLLSFFQNNYQFIIPFFQRAYVWDNDNWEVLWDHLMEELEAHLNQKTSEHFIGTIITKPKQQDSFSTQPMELIDGQQRLTTIAILLKAIADTSTGEFKKLRESVLKYLIFEDSRGDEFLRIKHGKTDTPYFHRVMEAEEFEEEENNIIEAYFYFRDKLVGFDDAKRDQLKDVLLHKIPVISMILNAEDDEQEIFDTINSLGTKLTIAELLKNYIFRDETTQALYESTWYAVFEEDEDILRFWGATKSSGRVNRTNLELLLYCFLIIESGNEVRLDRLFKEYKKYLADMDAKKKSQMLNRLKSYASIYYKFPSGQELTQITFAEHEKRLFHIIKYLEITTIYPLLLFVYQEVEERAERNQILQLIESYLIRRLVTKLSNKNYNRVFIQIVNELKKKGNVNFEMVKEVLYDYQEDTNRFPDNASFKEGFYNHSFYNKYAREILFCIALYQASHKYADVSSLSVDSYSVEHILPKKWETHWGDDIQSENQKGHRNYVLKTLGNLTLITGRLNSAMKNASWTDKKNYLKQYSSLRITTDYIDNSNWNEASINDRAGDLADMALDIWKKP